MKYDSFYIEKNLVVDQKDFEIVRLLYLPIIGVEASSFYCALVDEATLLQSARVRISQKELAYLLNISSQELIQAKEKLEAVGLINYFESDLYNSGLIEIRKPMDVKTFSNSIISKSLIAKIGQQRFDKILKHNAINNYSRSDYANKTKKFTEVFANEELGVFVSNNHDLRATQQIDLDDLENEKRLSPRDYIKHLTNLEPSPSQINMVSKLSDLGFTFNAINLFIDYSMKINKSIVCQYIEKIARDYANKNIKSDIDVENELQRALSYKISTNTQVDTQYLVRKSFKEESVLNWAELGFED
ncbi:DnaD domain protein [Mycoplasma sp. 4044]